MRKKIFIMLLIAFLTFGAVGCEFGGGGGGSTVVVDEVDLDEVYLNIQSQIKNKDNITGDITLPTKFGTVVVFWRSNNPDVIDNNGHVTRPNNDTEVLLECNLSDGTNQKTYQLRLIVKAKEDIHNHNNLVWVAEVLATSSSDGMKGHYYCSVCDKYFDENNNEVTRESLVIKYQVEEVFNTVSEVLSGKVGDSYKTKATVVAVSNVSFLVKDDTGYILNYYGTDYQKDLAVGDQVTIDGSTSTYSGSVQFNKASYIKTGNTNIAHPSANELDIEEINALVSTSSITVQYVKLTGKLSISGSYVNLDIEGSEARGSILTVTDVSELNAKLVEVEGYYIYISGTSTKFINILATSVLLCDDQGQENEAVTISEVINSNIGASYKTEGTVIAVSNVSFLVKDDTGYILNYIGTGFKKDVNVGDVVLLEGVTSKYSNSIQFSNALYEVKGNDEVTHPSAKQLSKEELEKLTSEGSAVVSYVSLEGVLKVSGAYVNLIIADTNVQGSLLTTLDVTEFAEKPVKVTGYYLYTNGSNSQYANIIVTNIELSEVVVPELELSMISEVLEGSVGATYKSQGIVVAKSARSIVLKDDSGLITVNFGESFDYNALNIGDKIEVEGPSYLYGGRIQFNRPSFEVLESTEFVNPDAIDLDKEKFEALATNEIDIKYYRLVAKLSLSGNYANLEIEGSEIAGSLVYPIDDLTSLDGQVVEVVGYFVYVSGSSKKYVSFIYTDIKKVESQTHETDTISEVLAGNIGDNYKTEGVVVAVSSVSFLVKDDTGYILNYIGTDYQNDLSVGDKVSLEGSTSTYSNAVQFNKATYSVLGTSEVNQPLATELTSLDLDNLASQDVPTISYVKLTAKLSISGYYLNLVVEGTTIQGSVLTNQDLSELDGKLITATGYYLYTTGGGRFVSIIATDISLESQDYSKEVEEIKNSIFDSYNNYYTVMNMTIPSSYNDASISWQSLDTDRIKVREESLEVIPTDVDTSVTLVGTISLNGYTDEVRVNILVGKYYDLSTLHALTLEETSNNFFASKGTIVAINSGYLIIQDDNDAMDVYTSGSNNYGDFLVGDKVIIRGLLTKDDLGRSCFYSFGNMIKVVEEQIEKEFDDISDVIVGTIANSYKIKATVVAVSSVSFLVKDDTGYILNYIGTGFNKDVNVGDVVIIEGNTSTYAGSVQISQGEYEIVDQTEFDHPTPSELLADDLSNLAMQETPTINYVKLTAKLSISGYYLNLVVEGTTVQGSVLTNQDLSELDGKLITVTGYYLYTTGGGRFVSIIATDIKEVEDENKTFTVSEVLAGNIGDNYKTEGVVVAISSVSFLIKDDTGYILNYMGTDYQNDLSVGDKVSLEGSTNTYSNTVQFNKASYSVLGTSEVSQPVATVITGQELEELATSGSISYVQVSGYLVQSGNYLNLEVKDSAVLGSVLTNSDITEFVNNQITITGYYLYTTGGGKYASIIITDIELNEDASLDYLFSANLTNPLAQNGTLYVLGYSGENITAIKATYNDGVVSALFNGEQDYIVVREYELMDGQALTSDKYNDYVSSSISLSFATTNFKLYPKAVYETKHSFSINSDGSWTIKIELYVSGQLSEPSFNLVNVLAFGFENGQYDVELYSEESVLEESNYLVSFEDGIYTITVNVKKELVDKYTSRYYYIDPNSGSNYKGNLLIDLYLEIKEDDIVLTPQDSFIGSFVFFKTLLDVVDTVGDGTIDNPLTVDDAYALASYLDKGVYTYQQFYIKGIVTNEVNEDYCDITFKTSDGKEFIVYGLFTPDGSYKYGYIANDVEGVPTKLDDEIVLLASIYHYVNGNGESVYETKEAKLITVNGNEVTYELVPEVQLVLNHEGTESDPFDEGDVVALASSFDSSLNTITDSWYYILVTCISEPTEEFCNFEFSDGVRNVVVWGLWTEDGSNRYGSRREIAELPIKNGDIVLLYAHVQNYYGKLELANARLLAVNQEN